MAGVRAVPGTKEIVDELVVHDSAHGVSALQGGVPRRGERMEIMQDNWAPGTRLAAGVAGTTLVLYAMRKKGVGSLLYGAAAAALLLRTATNKPLARLAGRDSRHAIDIQKTIHIDAPVDRVFEYLSRYENFPEFMRNVKRVEQLADGRSHWTVSGPAGIPVEWDACTTRLEPHSLIAWSSVEGSPVDHQGVMRIEPFGTGSRVHVRMSYSPPAGALGHAGAKLFGADPKSEMDEDLMRLKMALETGRKPRDAAAQDERRTTESSAT
jgi:uncharacterized membrane protein